MEDFSSLAEQGRIGEKVIPLKDGVELSGRIQVGERAADRVRRGHPLRLSDLPEGEGEKLKKGQRMGIFDGAETLLAIAVCQVDGGPGISENPQVLRILRVFPG